MINPRSIFRRRDNDFFPEIMSRCVFGRVARRVAALLEHISRSDATRIRGAGSFAAYSRWGNSLFYYRLVLRKR